MLVYSMATHYARLHCTMFYISMLCTCSYAYFLWQHTINHFILLYLWQHTVHHFNYTIFYGNTVHHFIMLLTVATLCTTSFCYPWQHTKYHFILLILLQHTVHHFILLYSVTTHYAPLHTTVFYGKSLCTTSYDSILWQHTMRNFILLYSVAMQYACLWPTRDLLCMSCITCTCKKSRWVVVYSCTQGKLKYNLSCAT
jgi:hypothetical protein